MKNNLEVILVSMICVSVPIISIILLSLLIWAVFGTSAILSLGIATLISVASVYKLYRMILKEMKDFNVNIEFEEDEEDFA